MCRESGMATFSIQFDFVKKTAWSLTIKDLQDVNNAICINGSYNDLPISESTVRVPKPK